MRIILGPVLSILFVSGTCKIETWMLGTHNYRVGIIIGILLWGLADFLINRTIAKRGPIDVAAILTGAIGLPYLCAFLAVSYGFMPISDIHLKGILLLIVICGIGSGLYDMIVWHALERIAP